MSTQLDRRTRLAGAITAALLALGYADLARGGDTLAPLLLMAGYVLGVPLTLLARQES